MAPKRKSPPFPAGLANLGFPRGDGNAFRRFFLRPRFDFSSPAHSCIDPAFLAKVDWVVAEAEKNHLTAILDYHNDDPLMLDPAANEARYLAIWRQVSGHFKNAPPTILFELLNEPHARFDGPTWNALLVKSLAIVRAANPTRSVVIGPVHYNGIGELKNLELPANDPHLIVTIHFYNPMRFTHQGARWIKGSDAWLGTKWLGTDAERMSVAKDFTTAEEWGQEHHRPIYLGEFGAYRTGDMDSRVRWISTVARTAEASDMPWTYWEFSRGFGVYDPQAKAWRAPILHALTGK